MFKNLAKNKKIGHFISFICVLISAFIQSFVINSFIQPADFLASGFTGVALLIDKIAGIFDKTIPVSITILILNIPVAILCYKGISKRFVFYSMLQVFFTSIFLRIFQFEPVFNITDNILNAIFGGFIFGIGVLIALKGRASTGGTDFIALYISNKKHKSIWNYVLIFNIILLCIFGALFNWSQAGYSILFQYVCTKTISTFHQRYLRVTLQITTHKPDEIVERYIKNFRHGLSCVEGVGGYSKKGVTVIHTVVSSYEVAEIIEQLKEVDPYVIINMFKTEQFYGKF